MRQCKRFLRKQTNRKSEFKLLQSRVEGEHSRARSALEVKSQEFFCMMMFGLEQMEVKFHEKLNETVGRSKRGV